MSLSARWRVVALLGVCAALIAGSIAPESRLAQQLTYFLILFVLIIPVHELGHAGAGALVGFRIMSIVVGSGPSLAAFQWRGVKIQINLLPLGGLTMGYAKRNYTWVRVRQWIFTVGGPAANVLIYVVLRRLYGAAGDSTQHPIVATAIVVNWSILAANLIPFRMAEGQRSDGYGLFTIPFWSRKQVDEALSVYSSLRVQDAMNRGDLAAARRLAEEAQLRFPESMMAYTVLGAVELRERRYDAALATWRTGLSKATEPKPAALLKNNIAFTEVVRGHLEDLPEADRFSAEAISVLPELPAVAGTRGAVLLRFGRAAEALPLLLLAESAATDARNVAYNKALVAVALAGVGRDEDARRKLADARQAEPDGELIPWAEAAISTGPLAAPAAAAQAGPASPDHTADVQALRRWRRDARILAFGVGFLVLDRLGLHLGPAVIAIVLSIAPELSGAIALAAYGLSAALLFALGIVPPDVIGGAPAQSAALFAFATGAAGAWLVDRYRRLAPPPPSRTPIVLGWILASLAILSLVADMLKLAWDGSPLSLHACARDQVSAIPSLIALAALLVSRRRRAARLFAVGPIALAFLAMVGASAWYLNRVALAEVPVDGRPIVWAAPTPAKVRKSVLLPVPGRDPAVSPGGRAFFTRRDEVGPAADGGAPGPRHRLRVGDFDGRVVEIPGTTAAFIDDERLLVLRPRDATKGAAQLAEVAPFDAMQPRWTKDLPTLNLDEATIRIERASGTIFIQGGGAIDAPIVLRTTLDPATPIAAHPLRRRLLDSTIAIPLPAFGWSGFLVSRLSGFRGELWWRALDGDRRLGARVGQLDCLDPPAGATQLWCLTSKVPILMRIDAATPGLARVPEKAPASRQQTMLGRSTIAFLTEDHLAVVDLDDRLGTPLTLPARDARARNDLVDGALATVTRTDRDSGETLTVYELPTGAWADVRVPR